MTDRRKARTWAEIDLGAMAHNYRALKALTPAGCGFLGLVKADAYGHGAVPVAKKLQELGADMLAVACAAEGEELRRGGIVLPILCLGQTDLHWPRTCWTGTSPRLWRIWSPPRPCPEWRWPPERGCAST